MDDSPSELERARRILSFEALLEEARRNSKPHGSVLFGPTICVALAVMNAYFAWRNFPSAMGSSAQPTALEFASLAHAVKYGFQSLAMGGLGALLFYAIYVQVTYGSRFAALARYLQECRADIQGGPGDA